MMEEASPLSTTRVIPHFDVVLKSSLTELLYDVCTFLNKQIFMNNKYSAIGHMTVMCKCIQ